MRSIRRERGVLKLVHAGRYVEVHREPIRAAEVMRRNPRHCVTRPDVFEFPWIVVKPESVLLPGSVFLIVPHSTIYVLIKAKGLSNQPPFSQQNRSPYNHVHHQLKQDSPVSCYAGVSSKFHKSQFLRRKNEGKGKEVEGELHSCNESFLSLPSLSPFSQRIPNYPSNTMSPDMENVCKYDWDISSQNQSYVELWPDEEISYEDTKKKIEQELLEESSFESIPYVAKQFYQNNKKDVNLDFVSNEQVTMLKSCLRRPDSIRKSLNLKVSFNIPINEEE